ncbi:MAG: tetratricopeptide repeat protein [Gammaproteobacteria bacterium]|nr:tetratricopeptide repeat protein [Gammaproteobacteria bacterium]
MENILIQLRKRQIFKVATIYAVSAWPLIQIADLAVPALGLPDSVLALLLKIFIIGFPVSLIFAWLINFTSEGMVRVSDNQPEQSSYKVNFRTTVAIAGSLIIALIVTLGSQLLIDAPVDNAALPLVGNTPAYSAVSAVDGLVKEKNQSIAVLPFVAFSQDPNDEFFIDGMVEELLNLLANIPDIRVAARTSSFSYKGVTDKTIVEIGRELGVDKILEGSFRKNDVTNKIRVTAQLIDVDSGDHLWSETYNREYLDIFKIQDEIAQAVVEKMKLTLLGDDKSREFAVGTHNVDAMVEYGKGQEELSHRTAASIEKALTHFQAAVERDSNYARAYVGIADANILLAMYGNLDLEVAKQVAQTAIGKALDLDEKLGNAYASRGLLLSPSDPEQAEIAFKRAIELSPSYAMAFMWYGSLKKQRGDITGSRQLFETAFKLDPRSPIAANNVAWAHYQEGSEGKAMELFSQIIANDPYYPGAYLLAGEILHNRGQLDGAIDMYERALRVDPVNKGAVEGLITTSMDMGDTESADEWFAYAEERSEIFDHSETVYLKARYFAAQGQIDKAIAYLDKVEFSAEEGKMHVFSDAEKAYIKRDFPAAIIAFEKLQAFDQAGQGYFFLMGEGRASLHLAYSYQQTDQPEKANQLISEHQQFLTDGIGRKTNDPNFYYNMAMIKTLQNQPDEALQFLQGAIDAGWVEIWRTGIEPILDPLLEREQFVQMIGGVNAKLTNMRTKIQDKSNFLAG